MGFRTPSEPIPDGERAFMLASTRYAIEEGDLPVKVKNFGKTKKDKGGSS